MSAFDRVVNARRKLLRFQQKSARDARSVLDLRYPIDFTQQWDNDFSKIVVALLDKSPQSMCELSARTLLNQKHLRDVLAANSTKFGNAIILFATSKGENASLYDVVEKAESFPYSSIGFSNIFSEDICAKHAVDDITSTVASLARTLRNKNPSCTQPT